MIGTLIEANDRIIAALEMYDTVRVHCLVSFPTSAQSPIAFEAHCDREGCAERTGRPRCSEDQ